MDENAPDPSPPAPAPAEATKPAPRKESWWDTLRFFLILFVAAVAIRTFLVAPFSIPSGSMLPTLMIGDYLFIAKWKYGYSRYSLPFGLAAFEGRMAGGVPERGDVVVFRYPGGDDDFVKRVIGVAGDTIEVRGGIVHLNGRPVQRRRIADYVAPVSRNSPCRPFPGGGTRPMVDAGGEHLCAYPRFRETLPGGRSYDVIDQESDSPGDDFGPLTVPQGQLFVMGDNRDDSQDSRFARAGGGVGLLPVENVLGEALIGFWSTDGSAAWLKPWTWFSAARWDRIGQTY